MADQMVAEMDTRALFAAMDRLGDAILKYTKPAALQTAKNIQAEARARVRRRTGQTADNIVIEEDHSGIGYVVRTSDVRSRASTERLTTQRKMFGSSRRGVTAHENEAHVGRYLEYGTVDMAARPFFWASARIEEGAFDRRMRAAIQTGIDEVGLGD